MPYLLFALLVGMPAAEIAVLILVGSQIGVLPTVAAILATAIAGAYLVRRQGLATLERARHELNGGRIPAGTLAEGIGILIAGVLLLTPGFITDATGFALLVPALRRAVIAGLAGWFAGRIRVIRGAGAASPGPGRGRVIEGEVVSSRDEEAQRGPSGSPSPWRGP